MTYDETIAWLQTMCEVPLNNADENFQRIIPAMMLYADGRIYRDLKFLATLTSQPISLTAHDREFALPVSVRALRAVNVCTPAGPSISRYSKRSPLERITAEMLDFIWPQSSYRPGVPQKYAVLGSGMPGALQHIVRVMPTPDQNYQAELLGDIRPLPLSPTNPETFLSVTYPELYLCACMVFAAGYQRDFGAQADDPARAASWEQQYSNLRQGVMGEAAAMRGEGAGTGSAAQPGTP